MPKAKYRIDRVTVEGFRGFTTPQMIVFDTSNLFIFGPNGGGKSSIVEAIRWCLFGSPQERDIEVRNTFYEKGDCVVALVLSGGQGQLTLSRQLRPGATRSRLSVVNAAGETLQ